MQGKAKVSLTFGLYEGGQLVRRETVTQDIVKVGKDPKSHLRVDDELASRMHAVIEVASPDDITLIDLGNEPGTIVNGSRVNKSGPDVNPDEVELGHVTAVEVMILWETTVLHVQHLTPPRSFYVGEEEGKNYQCDYFIPSEKIGTTRAPIVLADHGSINFVILPRARGTIEIPGQPKMTLEDAVRSGRTQPCTELSGAQQMALPSGGKARMEIDGLVFQVAAVPAGKPLVHGLFATSDFNK